MVEGRGISKCTHHQDMQMKINKYVYGSIYLSLVQALSQLQLLLLPLYDYPPAGHFQLLADNVHPSVGSKEL